MTTENNVYLQLLYEDIRKNDLLNEGVIDFIKTSIPTSVIKSIHSNFLSSFKTLWPKIEKQLIAFKDSIKDDPEKITKIVVFISEVSTALKTKDVFTLAKLITELDPKRDGL